MKNNENIHFKLMVGADLPLWEGWIEKPHVKNVWFIEGYETSDYIHQKISGNGYDFPFIIYCDDTPIGYIQCSDLHAYTTKCPKPKGIFTEEEPPGVFSMDLFIGEEDYQNKGYGSKIVSEFVNYLFENFHAKTIYIDPARGNKQAIRCYEKAGFTFVKEAFDGVTDCYVMKIEK